MSESRNETKRRNYRQVCALAKALDVVGERWTLLIVRNLLVGPQRYGELVIGLPGVTTNLLAKRLKEMAEAGLVTKTDDEYALTSDGLALEPVLFALGNFGERYLPAARATDARNPRWAVVSLKRRYRGGQKGAIELRFGERVFQLELGECSAKVVDRPTWVPDVVISGNEGDVAALVTGRAPGRMLEESGAVHVLGSRLLYRGFLRSVGVAL
jgi:DNA-binding HxlR family transcriptional regulator